MLNRLLVDINGSLVYTEEFETAEQAVEFYSKRHGVREISVFEYKGTWRPKVEFTKVETTH